LLSRQDTPHHHSKRRRLASLNYPCSFWPYNKWMMSKAMASPLLADITCHVPHTLSSTREHLEALPILQLSPYQLAESM
jgi:hypothetical protein